VEAGVRQKGHWVSVGRSFAGPVFKSGLNISLGVNGFANFTMDTLGLSPTNIARSRQFPAKVK
jgi:hypothetical protein